MSLISLASVAMQLRSFVDVPPIGNDKRPVVPMEEWQAVKQYREIYLHRQAVAAQLDNIDRGLRGMIAKTPALAFVTARKAVPV